MMRSHSHLKAESRAGFTLVELLVVTSIIVFLLALTLTAFNLNGESDRIRKGARQLQSYLKGAQDRAIWSRSPVGVRLYVQPDLGGNDPEGRIVTTLAYIGQRRTWPFTSDPSIARVDLERSDLNSSSIFDDATEDANADGILDPGEDILFPNGRLDDEVDIFVVRGFNDPGWFNLDVRGFFDGSQRIRIPAGPSGEWYPFEFIRSEDINGNGTLDIGEDLDGDGMLTTNLTAATNQQLLRLLVPYHDQGSGPSTNQVAHIGLTYEIELAWKTLPEEPCILPDNVVIDLDASKVPGGWRPALTGTGRYAPYLDIVFSPQGTVLGEAAGAGLLHLYVCDREDSQYLKEEFIANEAGTLAAFDGDVPTIPFVPLDEIPTGNWVSADNNYLVKERRIVSIFSQTGHVGVSQVNAYVGESGNPADSDGDLLADDPYRFAETGEEAN